MHIFYGNILGLIKLIRGYSVIETQEKPADLSSKIVFKVPNKSKKDHETKSKKRESSETIGCKDKKRSKQNLLSFDAEGEDDN